MQPRIVSLVSYAFLPAKVGGQKHIALFYEYLSAYIPVHCVTTSRNDPAYAKGYRVENILSTSIVRYMNPFYFFLLRKRIRQEAASHLLIEHPYYGWLAVLLKWFCKVPLVIHSHNIESIRFKTIGKPWWRLLWYYERFVHRQADYNLFITDADKAYAVKAYGLVVEKCMTATYGITTSEPPAAEAKAAARAQLLQHYGLAPATTLLFFNGTFDYLPNRQGLYSITEQLNPLLARNPDFKYAILVCGRDIPEALLQTAIPNVYFAGFVNDISQYFMGADVFINPITSGGGIKTKLVEALGYNLNAVSTRTGATGIPTALCGEKLLLSDDGDWRTFAENIIRATRVTQQIPAAYYDFFYWGSIAKRTSAFLTNSQIPL